MFDSGLHIFFHPITFPEDADASRTKVAPGWNLRILFATEPALAIIAIDAASMRTGTQKERIAALSETMKKADGLIGEDAADPRLRDKAAWDFFNDYIFELLRL